jgi:large subunit ribosomal protein L29
LVRLRRRILLIIKTDPKNLKGKIKVAILRNEDIRDLSNNEMEDKIIELRNELLREKSMIAAGGAAENPGRIKEIKRTIARILTIKQEGVNK